MQSKVNTRCKSSFHESKGSCVKEIQRVIGIDPGHSGGLSIIDPRDKKITRTLSMPLCEGQRRIDTAAIREFIGESATIVIEQVPFSIGAVGNSASEFKLGMAYGLAIGALFDKDLKFITPRKWQGLLSLSKDKHQTIDWVKKHFKGFELCKGPRGGVLDGITDSVAIAYAWWIGQQIEENTDDRGRDLSTFFRGS